MGGETSWLHRHTPYQKNWSLMKDGDLSEAMQEAVISKGPNVVNVTKLKGHAIVDMVEIGAVRIEDKMGNDVADHAAVKGQAAGHGAAGGARSRLVSQGGRLDLVVLVDVEVVQPEEEAPILLGPVAPALEEADPAVGDLL